MKRLFLIAAGLALQSCTVWQVERDVREVTIRKVETDQAGEICLAFTNKLATACAIWLPTHCVVIVHPRATESLVHEAGGHCMGLSHG